MLTLTRVRNPEVDHLRRAVIGHEEIFRGHISMDHVIRLAVSVLELVRRMQPFTRLRDDPRRTRGEQR